MDIEHSHSRSDGFCISLCARTRAHIFSFCNGEEAGGDGGGEVDEQKWLEPKM